MKLKSITIAPGSDYGPHKGKFVGKCVVTGQLEYSETEINVTIDPEDLVPITAMVAQLVARNMTAAADAFRADVEANLLPKQVVEHVAIEAPTPPPAPGFVDDQDDPIPF